MTGLAGLSLPVAYEIPGGGAGAVVAARLTENPHWKVLIVEAGCDEPTSGEVPASTGAFIGSAVDWNYKTTNESFACLATNGSCSLSTGKMLGGSTGRNGMIYNRGVPTDFNNWAAQGNEGWMWDDVIPYYLLAENNGEIERVGRLYHATGGPLSVERHSYLPSVGLSVLAAAAENGYNISEDLNGEQITGFTIAQTTTKNGVRCSSATAYLRPARNRKNLHISLDSRATKVIIRNNKAVGVEYHKDGQLWIVNVSREVVISAGTVGSPQLLLLSGIGPSEHLEAVGVEVVKDLPGTGENYHDHVGYSLSFTINETDEYDNNWAVATEYIINQTGPLSGRGLAPVMATLVTEAASSDFPDLQFQFTGYVAVCAPGEIGALRTTGKRTVGVRINNLHPKSKGRISLAPNDPLKDPILWGNYLGEIDDVDVLLHGIKVALALADTQALQAHNFTLSTTSIEACSNYTFMSTEYWTCAIRQSAGASTYHLAGSCKMGPASDSMAVVNSRLQVHGIKGLRVADASIMPEVVIGLRPLTTETYIIDVDDATEMLAIPDFLGEVEGPGLSTCYQKVTSGNTVAPAMMIGERAAAFIKKDWLYYPQKNARVVLGSSEKDCNSRTAYQDTIKKTS